MLVNVSCVLKKKSLLLLLNGVDYRLSVTSRLLFPLIPSPEKMLTVAFESFQKFPMQIWVLNYT